MWSRRCTFLSNPLGAVQVGAEPGVDNGNIAKINGGDVGPVLEPFVGRRPALTIDD